jgi:hypothetical protein
MPIERPRTHWPVRSLIRASDFPAQRAQVQNVDRRSWKRSGSTLSAFSSKRMGRVSFAVERLVVWRKSSEPIT